MNTITKSIYPTVAKTNRTSTVRVERAMRNAIANAWSKNHTMLMKKIFENEEMESRKPTNSEFVAVIADKIKLENEYINWQERPNK